MLDFLNIYVDLFINISSNSIRITMLPSDIRSMQEAYRNVYEESDLLLDDLIEEIVEELIEECLEFGYTLDESADAVEAAAILYIDEATVTYGSDTISPEDRRTEAKSRLKDMKASKRKAAVKGAVERVKSTASGVKAAAGIAGSIAKDEVRRAGRSATHAAGKAASAAGSAVKGAAGAVSAAASKKKAEVKQGVKGLIGRGLRKAAGAIGNVAQRAAGAASRLGEAKVEIYDVVLEYLCTEGYAEDFEDAESIMVYLEPGAVEAIAESGWHRRNPEKIGSSEDPDVRMKSSTGGRSSSAPSKPPTAAEKKGHRRVLYNYYGQGGKEEAIKRAKAERDAARTKRNK